MNDDTKNILNTLWSGEISAAIIGKKINISRYQNLQSCIPDKLIELEEIFPKNEIELICKNFKPYTNKYEVEPFIGTLGGNAICIGNSANNLGKIYYFDFDFGCFALDSNLNDFVIALV